MSALINDTKVLAQSLNEHQHLAKDLNEKIQKDWDSVSRPNSPGLSTCSFTVPLVSGNNLSSEPHSPLLTPGRLLLSPGRRAADIESSTWFGRSSNSDRTQRPYPRAASLSSLRSAPSSTLVVPNGAGSDRSVLEMSKVLHRDIAHLGKRASMSPSIGVGSTHLFSSPSAPVNSFFQSPAAASPSTTHLRGSSLPSRSLSPAYSVRSPASLGLFDGSPGVPTRRPATAQDWRKNHGPSEPFSPALRRRDLSPGLLQARHLGSRDRRS